MSTSPDTVAPVSVAFVAVWAVCLKTFAVVSSLTKQVNPCAAVTPGVIVRVHTPFVPDRIDPASEFPVMSVSLHPDPETFTNPLKVVPFTVLVEPLGVVTPGRSEMELAVLPDVAAPADATLFRLPYCVRNDVPVPEFETMLE